jgi:hypothetical protein
LHFMNHFPKGAKIACKKPPTKSFYLHVGFLLLFIDMSDYFYFTSLNRVRCS